jgi:hypothetical protein
MDPTKIDWKIRSDELFSEVSPRLVFFKEFNVLVK